MDNGFLLHLPKVSLPIPLLIKTSDRQGRQRINLPEPNILYWWIWERPMVFEHSADTKSVEVGRVQREVSEVSG